MALRMASAIPARVIQVLQDRLPAELDLIDAEEADGITTGDVSNEDYFEFDRDMLHADQFPAVTLNLREIDPIEVLPDLHGQRLDARYIVDVKIHVRRQIDVDDATRLQKLIHRYTAGIFRVLFVMYEKLQTIADPTQFAEIVTPAGSVNLGPEAAQGSGSFVRTATIPVSVRRREAR